MSNVFYNCISLSEVNISNINVLDIKNDMFDECSDDIRNQIKEIYRYLNF